MDPDAGNAKHRIHLVQEELYELELVLVIIDMKNSNLLHITTEDPEEHRDSSDEYSNYNKGIQEQ